MTFRWRNVIPGQKRSGLFIHVPRTGGRALLRIFNCPSSHYPAAEHRRRIPKDVWDSLWKFAVVRNPWDQYVSMWLCSHGRGNPDDRHGEVPVFRRWIADGGLSLKVGGGSERVRALDQMAFIADGDGKLLIDRVYIFPRLQDAADDAHKILNTRAAEVPHVGREPRLHYREYYDDESRRAVANWRKAEIKQFGFKFET